jgi:hypothetical protein
MIMGSPPGAANWRAAVAVRFGRYAALAQLDRASDYETHFGVQEVVKTTCFKGF